MTFSIAACDLEKEDWGVAVASKFPAVGTAVPWARAGVGAVATQALANIDYGPDGLRMLAEGRSAEETIAALTGADDGRDHRQLGIVDRDGGSATFTGTSCIHWAGGIIGEGFACQGNILTGAEVVQAMADAYRSAGGELVDRLLAALKAADDAGGDRRGKQAAAVLVARAGGGYEGRGDRYIDLRVDDHTEPVLELMRVFDVYDREYLIRNDPLVRASPALVADLQRRLTATGRYGGEASGTFDQATRAALAAFAGEVNLEAKVRDADQIYGSVIHELRDITPELPAP